MLAYTWTLTYLISFSVFTIANDAKNFRFKPIICVASIDSRSTIVNKLRSHLPGQFRVIELIKKNDVGESWLERVCAPREVSCNALIIHGEFEGVLKKEFYGENSATTLSYQTLQDLRSSSTCPNLIRSPRLVALLGSNTHYNDELTQMSKDIFSDSGTIIGLNQNIRFSSEADRNKAQRLSRIIRNIFGN